MAKITLTKVAPTKVVEPKMIEINEQKISVIQYLPLAAKNELTQWVLNATVDTTGFLNPVRLEEFLMIAVIKWYTNITLTDKQLEDADKTYDLLAINGVLDAVIGAIPEDEYNAVFDCVEDAAEAATNYLNSFVGAMRTILDDYKNTDMNIEKLMNDLGNPEQVGLVKEIVEKLG